MHTFTFGYFKYTLMLKLVYFYLSTIVNTGLLFNRGFLLCGIYLRTSSTTDKSEFKSTVLLLQTNNVKPTDGGKDLKSTQEITVVHLVESL